MGAAPTHRPVRCGTLDHAATFLQLPYLQSYAGKVWDEPSGPQATGCGPLQRLYYAADTWFFLGTVEKRVIALD